MDAYGNIYDVEQMRKRFETDENKEQLDKLIEEDQERFKGELEQKQAELEMRRRLRAPFKK